MHLTIFSDKLPHMTAADFTHKFRVVHASETRSVATNLGIILQYIQGLALPTLNKPGLSNLPLKEGRQYQSFARLTWPSVEVIQGSFSTEDYRRSAGKHIFAAPFRIFLTEFIKPPSSTTFNTEPLIASPTVEQDAYSIRLVVTVFPNSNSALSRAKFEEKWDRHAAWTHGLNIRYSRYAVIPLDQEHIQRIFDQTPFDPLLVAEAGGYDEFLFASHNEATAFLNNIVPSCDLHMSVLSIPLNPLLMRLIILNNLVRRIMGCGRRRWACSWGHYYDSRSTVISKYINTKSE